MTRAKACEPLEQAEHVDEYPDSTLAMLELIWGEGFMSPGGKGHVLEMVVCEKREMLQVYTRARRPGA